MVFYEHICGGENPMMAFHVIYRLVGTYLGGPLKQLVVFQIFHIYGSCVPPQGFFYHGCYAICLVINN